MLKHISANYEGTFIIQIIILILLTTCVCISTSDYPSIKRRVYGGPPQGGPPRPPPQFMKKWGKPPPQKIQPQFPQNRFPPMRNNRPKPQPQNNYNPGFNGQGNGHHGPVPNNFAGPKFQSNKPRPGPPGKGFFKNPVQQFKSPNIVPNSVQFPQETKIVPNILPTKPEQHSFVSSPSIPEYDYHIQTNNIPINTQPIKQVGEIGPIHTIPAPNLGPADKSNHLEQKKKQLQLQQQQRYRQEFKQQYVTESPPIVHQYQVTEPSELAHFHRDELNQATHQIAQSPALSYQHLLPNDLKKLHAVEGQSGQGYQNLPSTLFVQDNFALPASTNNNDGISIVFDHLHEGEPAQDMAFPNGNHYQAVNNGYNVAKPSGHTQAIQSSFVQQQPQLLPQFMQALPGYIAQYQSDNIQAPNKNGQPEYQTFNYDEQSHQAQSKAANSANFVSATYSLGLSDEIQPDQAPNTGNSLNQAQIAQNYFGSRADTDTQTRRKDTDISNPAKSGFYASVANKEIADRLAQLQAAGRVNSNLMQINSSQNHEDDNDDNDDASIERSDKNETSDIEYDDDYSDEEQSKNDQDRDFGHKIASRQ